MNRIAITDNEADELARAEQQVAESRARLSLSLREVGKSSENLARRLGNELRPTLAVAGAVAGAAVVVGVAIALVRRGKRRQGWFAPEPPSALGVAAKSAGLWALRFVARRVAQELVSRLAEPTLESQADAAQ
jgi:hypothetical protein